MLQGRDSFDTTSVHISEALERNCELAVIAHCTQRLIESSHPSHVIVPPITLSHSPSYTEYANMNVRGETDLGVKLLALLYASTSGPLHELRSLCGLFVLKFPTIYMHDACP